MSAPFFSIIVPSYQSAAYLRETLLSLAQQVCRDFEVIVVDDRSSDDSVVVARNAMSEFQLTGEVLVKPASLPRGVAANRNFGILNASGTWISFLDSDDLFLPGKLSGTLRLIERFGDTCLAFHHGIRRFADGSGVTISVSDLPADDAPRDIAPQLLLHNFITTSSVTVKKSLIDALGGFDVSLHGVEDYLLWLRVAKKTNWFFCSDTWTDYRVRGSSLMGNREMTHYITQNKNLLLSAQGLHEFPAAELAILEKNLMDSSMGYYALVSLNEHGWGDFMKGLAQLAAMGRAGVAGRLFAKHFRNLVLRNLAAVKKAATGHR